MTDRKGIIAGLLLASFLTAVGNASAAEVIHDWHSDITVHQDGSMLVTETIRVRADGVDIKRGIFRDFPTTYTDRFGNRVKIGFDLLSVKKDGQTEPYHTDSMSNGVRIYIGSSGVFLKPGDYTYTISYRTDRHLGFFDEHDELFWNVTGNGWMFPIEKVTASVHLPSTISPGDLRTTAYTGPQGIMGNDFISEVDNQGRVLFRTTRPLAPREGLTIVVGWPTGHIARPAGIQKVLYFFSDNRNMVTGAVGFAVLLLYYLWAWNRAGRDPEKGTVIPRFEPPDNLSPAATRYISEMSFDNRAFASAVINLAVKGYLIIKEEEKVFGFKRVYTLKRTDGEPAVPLSRGEKKLARKLFPGNSRTLKLESENHSRVSGAIEALKDLLTEEYEKTTFLTNSGYMAPGIIITAATLVVAGISSGSHAGQLLFAILWFIPWTGVTLFLWASRRFFMAAVFTFFLVTAGGAFTVFTSFSFMAILIALIVTNVLFYKLLKAPTNLGRRVMDRIDGFKMYLSAAEEHRLEKLHPPERTPDLFEKYLPYALALEVDQQWSEKFADVLSRAAASGRYSPGWYSGRHWNHMHTGRFASDLGTAMSSAISSAATAPGSSSGFGGGGGSGGGGGGGGGGGW